jgi:hypothetical protein
MHFISLINSTVKFITPWKRKIIFREAESAFLVPGKRKIILREAERVFLVPWKRKIILREAESVFWYLGKRFPCYVVLPKNANNYRC